MIASWIANGAAIGITAFFAVVVFALCVGVLLGIVALLGALFGNRDEVDQ